MAKKKTEDDGKKKDSKKKIIAAVAVALIGYKFFLAPKPAAKAEGAPKKEGAVVALPELTLNLANGKYLRVGIALVYWEGHGGGGGGHGASTGPDKEASIASDVAVTVLSAKAYDELNTTDGKNAAKAEITEKVNHALEEAAGAAEHAADDPPVARILFTSFVMQ